MFWIGMIVGIVVGLGIAVGEVVWACHSLGISREEFQGMSECIGTACTNRESRIAVVKDYEDEEFILTEVTLKET